MILCASKTCYSVFAISVDSICQVGIADDAGQIGGSGDDSVGEGVVLLKGDGEFVCF